KVCTKAHVFEQNCGWDGNKTCIKGFNKILEYPFHCECDIYDAAESRRICTCKFPSTLLNIHRFYNQNLFTSIGEITYVRTKNVVLASCIIQTKIICKHYLC
ncbi:hypothetical protein F2Q68_00032381, partial [Brassica cretica]